MKRKIKWKNIIISMLFILFSIGMIFSLFKIITWYIENKNTKERINDVYEKVKVKETNDGKAIENNAKANDPYWDFIKMNLIDVNFDELINMNNETVGWIQVNGTNINYPFVQTTNNSYYLNHSFDKSYNSAGWVFADYRNNINEFDKNTILYAHGRLDNSMFGSLRNILKNSWYNNPNNYVIKLSTKYENTLWQVFSIYRIKTTNDYIQTSFSDNSEFNNFVNTLLQRSKFNFNTNVNGEDKIITLSTCYDDNDKVVMHAKLIKIKKR